ncbi:MAG: DNA-binding protein [Burkholderiales bacterium 12-64-5]|nr:MAG: DNA-binding protein [Burkholderiales bacterium 12-64-5]
MSDPTAPELGPDARYAAFLAEGTFRIQRCGGCEAHVFPPRILCPKCGGSDLDWVMPKGGGTVYSCSVIFAKPENGGDYNVSLIDLDEGVRLMSRVESIPPALVHVGMRVRAQVTVSGDAGLVVFVPEDLA